MDSVQNVTEEIEGGYRNYLRRHEKVVDWQHAERYFHNTLQVYEIPVFIPNTLLQFGLEQNSEEANRQPERPETEKITPITKLIIAHTPIGYVFHRVMTILPGKEHSETGSQIQYFKEVGEFSGMTLIHSWHGNFLNGSLFETGRLTHSVLEERENNSQTSSIREVCEVIPINEYVQHCEEWIVNGESEGEKCDPVELAGEVGEIVVCSEGAPSDGGGGNTSPSGTGIRTMNLCRSTFGEWDMINDWAGKISVRGLKERYSVNKKGKWEHEEYIIGEMCLKVPHAVVLHPLNEDFQTSPAQAMNYMSMLAATAYNEAAEMTGLWVKDRIMKGAAPSPTQFKKEFYKIFKELLPITFYGKNFAEVEAKGCDGYSPSQKHWAQYSASCFKTG